jgi:hypothetical protein
VQSELLELLETGMLDSQLHAQWVNRMRWECMWKIRLCPSWIYNRHVPSREAPVEALIQLQGSCSSDRDIFLQ